MHNINLYISRAQCRLIKRHQVFDRASIASTPHSSGTVHDTSRLTSHPWDYNSFNPRMGVIFPLLLSPSRLLLIGFSSMTQRVHGKQCRCWLGSSIADYRDACSDKWHLPFRYLRYRSYIQIIRPFEREGGRGIIMLTCHLWTVPVIPVLAVRCPFTRKFSGYILSPEALISSSFSAIHDSDICKW